MVRIIKVRQMILCPELTQYVSTSRCLTCKSHISIGLAGVQCKFEDKGSMRVMLDEDN